jgi:hypothetical protein
MIQWVTAVPLTESLHAGIMTKVVATVAETDEVNSPKMAGKAFVVAMIAHN